MGLPLSISTFDREVVDLKPRNQGFMLSNNAVLQDYRTAITSRLTSLLGRKEVLGGKAKFGIFGDGKEVAQLAMARAFQKGDWRSGYYRDQTFMFALGLSNPRGFFAQLYADPDLKREPASGGRQMNCHFATRTVSPDGHWFKQVDAFNSSADVSPTGGQMARLVGLAYASKLYRQEKALQQWTDASCFSMNGNEVAFGTIGNASVAEGIFWEAVNAAGVLQVPFAISVWDDDYGISVPNELQITKRSISEIIKGFASSPDAKGYDLYTVKGYDYEALLETYTKAIGKCRKEHSPCLIHVTHMTQPQGHSTSGSHERYKSPERLQYEDSIDCVKKMREWILNRNIADPQTLENIENECREHVEQERQAAWDAFQNAIKEKKDELIAILQTISQEPLNPNLQSLVQSLEGKSTLLYRDVYTVAHKILYQNARLSEGGLGPLSEFLGELRKESHRAYNSCLLNETARSPLNVNVVPPSFGQNPQKVDGRQIIQMYFQKKLKDDPRVFIIGEDVGTLGGVNLEFENLSEEWGSLRVTDTGIREATILGQGIGAALRGLRPVVDIQYLDYLIYALQGLSDDLATLHYRTAGGQCAPVVIRTKGHRLEGIWHTGSPMGMLLGSIRGVHLCVPRNCVQAAGMYQTLFAGDDPALVIEVLNGYRVKEALPENLGAYSVPLGHCEILRPGKDLTLVTYGACVQIALAATQELSEMGIDVEVIDVQTLLPFDLKHMIAGSVVKTNSILFLDEDVPGGASAFMLQQVLETQKAYESLDAPPRTLTAKAHRSAYGSDGDYFSKPNVQDVLETIYDMMRERFPSRFPQLR